MYHHHSCHSWLPHRLPWSACGGHPLRYGMPAPWFYSVPWCSSCGQPLWYCSCAERLTMYVPQEIAVDPAATTKEIVVGGAGKVDLILEYMPVEGAAAPEVTLESKGPSGTTSFHETSIAAGYHVKDDFSPAVPGTKLKLTVKDCFARLRWCERMKY